MKIKMMIIALVLSMALCVPMAFADVEADAKAKADAASIGVGEVNVLSPQQFPNAMTIIPNPIPLIQGGRVGDVTAQVGKFAIPATAYNGEKIKRVLKVIKGSIFDRVRLEDIEIDLLDGFKSVVDKYASKSFDLAKVRYLVQYKDSAMGAGIGGGASGNINGIASAQPYGGAASGAILPGYARSTADPAYFIKFFEVE